MKRIILILLFIVTPLYAQFDAWSQFNNPFSFYNAPMNRPVVFTYTQRAVDFFKRVTDLGLALPDSTKQTIDSIFITGINHGYFGTTRLGDSVVAWYNYSLKISINETIAKLNILEDKYNCTNVNGIVFSDSGARGDGLTSYLNTGFNFKNDSSIYKMNSAGYGMLSQTNVTGNNVFIGSLNSGLQGSWILLSGGGLYPSINTAAMFQVITSGTTKKLYTCTKNDYSSTSFIVNQTVFNYSQNGNVQVNSNFWVCAGNGGGTIAYPTKAVISNAWIISGLSNAKVQLLHSDANNVLKKYSLNIY